ncbi:MFS general substrate transporter [Phanerochaete sordida]|uniref:MFS general substrate transporter n=1 Tax=Phanerochaete sordida TaxID=48140 RepID=A0A9P3GBY9_9APHY|nr:MFS general substrate transporter [Phanerochaete sordida]
MATVDEHLAEKAAKEEAGTAPAPELEANAPAADASDEPPDGGLRAWMCVAGGWLACFSTFGYSSSFGVYQDLYTLAGMSSASNISWIGSVQLSLMFMLGLFSGRLLDEGYFHHICISGSILYVFSMFMLSLADTSQYYQVLLSQGIGMGVGGGLVLVPAVSVQAHHWKHRRSLAMGITFTGSSCGGIVFPIMLNHLLTGAPGFAWGTRAAAFLVLALLAAANALMGPRLPRARTRAARPGLRLREKLTDAPFLVAIAGIFLIFWGLFLPYFYLQLFVTLHGASPSFAFYTLTILNGASTFGRTLLNALGDAYGPLNMLCGTAALTGALLFAMFGAGSTPGAALFAAVYGFFSGGWLSLLPPSVAVMSRDVREIGVRMGVVYFITSYAILTGTPIAGALLKNDDWGRPIAFSGVVTLAGAGFLLISRHLYAKRRGTQRI